MRKGILQLILLLLLCISASAQDKTFTFVTRDTLDLKLDIYVPDTPRSDSACLVYIFGGGFVTGARNDKYAIDFCSQLADEGFVVAAIEYRLGFKGHKVKGYLEAANVFEKVINDASEDCAAAVAFLIRHSDDLRINPDNIFLIGSSAGAITALETDYLHANRSSITSDLPDDFIFAGIISFAGGIFTSDAPVVYKYREPSPTMFLHGTDDKVVNYNKIQFFKKGLFGSNQLVKRFKKFNYQYVFLRFEGNAHDVAMLPIKSVPEIVLFAELCLNKDTRNNFDLDATVTIKNYSSDKWKKINLKNLY